MSTIVAIATALGAGGIGIVRLSGEDALQIANGIFAVVRSSKKEMLRAEEVKPEEVKPEADELEKILKTLNASASSSSCSISSGSIIGFSSSAFLRVRSARAR